VALLELIFAAVAGRYLITRMHALLKWCAAGKPAAPAAPSILAARLPVWVGSVAGNPAIDHELATPSAAAALGRVGALAQAGDVLDVNYAELPLRMLPACCL
jgi:hypothetical protein